MAWHHPPVRHSGSLRQPARDTAVPVDLTCPSPRNQHSFTRACKAWTGAQGQHALHERPGGVKQLLDALLTSQRERWQHLTAQKYGSF